MQAKIHSVTQTAYPDGEVVEYKHGMKPPIPKPMGHIMKNAAFEAVQEQTKVNRKLKKVA